MFSVVYGRSERFGTVTELYNVSQQSYSLQVHCHMTSCVFLTERQKKRRKSLNINYKLLKCMMSLIKGAVHPSLCASALSNVSPFLMPSIFYDLVQTIHNNAATS